MSKWITTIKDFDGNLHIDTNHVISNKELIPEIYERYTYSEPVGEGNVYFTHFYDGFGKGGCAEHSNGEVVLWENVREFFDRARSFKIPIKDYEFGYTIGTHGPYRAKGMTSSNLHDGYQMWERYKTI